MKTTTVDLERRQVELLEKMDEEGDVDNRSEGIREAIELKGEEHGYVNGKKKQTKLKSTVHKIANAFAWVALGLIGATWFYPVSFRFLVFAPLISAGFLYSFESYLESREPDVSNKLKALVGREKA